MQSPRNKNQGIRTLKWVAYSWVWGILKIGFLGQGRMHTT